MKFFFLAITAFLFTFQAHSQTLAYADTISTPVGDFMLETNEAPVTNISFDHQQQTAEDGGEAESVNFFPSTERKSSSLIAENVSFSIDPNPASESIKLQVKNGGELLKVRISDISGRLISERNYYEADGNYLNTIDLSGYTSGIYFVELNTGGYHFSKKLVKE